MFTSSYVLATQPHECRGATGRSIHGERLGDRTGDLPELVSAPGGVADVDGLGPHDERARASTSAIVSAPGCVSATSSDRSYSTSDRITPRLNLNFSGLWVPEGGTQSPENGFTGRTVARRAQW